MSDKTERISFRCSLSLKIMLEEYQKAKQLKSLSESILSLIEQNVMDWYLNVNKED
jgi:hypothetical protein